MQKWKVVLTLLTVLLSSCAFDDDERCAEGLYYEKALGYCRAVTPFDHAVTKDEGVDTGAGILNLKCNTNVDCVGNGQMTYCVLGASGFGVCSINNCTPGTGCQSDEFICIDCGVVPAMAPFFPDPICGVAQYRDAFEDMGCNMGPILASDDTDSAAGPVDTGSETQDTASGTSDTADTSVGTGVSGLECMSDADCANNGIYDYCFAVFGTPSVDFPGACVQDECTSGSCVGEDQECCDCTAVELIVWPSNLCMPSMYLTGEYGYETQGCTCD